ncbi:MAG: diaminopimelate epimerase [Kiritimatiellae bacterium]|nr:diaminopimelate epimerase [Kiritimatiellia bacterium]
MMTIPFYKMHGAANDFILVDDRSRSFPLQDRGWIARIAARRTGVGCEGIILIQPSDQADFRMRFMNPDGSEVEMCGNGARCVARLAYEIGAAPREMRIETIAGELRAEILDDRVRLRMTDPKDWVMDGALDAGGRRVRYGFVNSGVPHAVIESEDLQRESVREMGAALRYHERFAPRGTNVNFAQVIGASSARVRTYERGVEDETLACGTGIVATALVLARSGRIRLPAEIHPASGDVLIVDGRAQPDGGYTDVTLTGPAVHVYRGTIEYPGDAS